MSLYNQQQGFWVADWWVQPALSELRKDGQVIQLEPKVMAVLQHLASRPGEAISRQDLEDTIWQGTIVSYDALAKAINKLRDALGDDKKHPKYIKTIPKKGYQLIAQVRIETPQPEIPESTDKKEPSELSTTQQLAFKPWFIGGGIALLIAFLSILFLFLPYQKTNETALVKNTAQTNYKPTIVVLPFKNISSSRDDDYLAEGLTSDLTTDLSKLSGLWVVSSNAVLTYKGNNMPPQIIRKKFNARYVLTGDLNKVDQTIRINAHLTDVEQGAILWANRYDRKYTDLFAIQNDVTQQIAQSLSVTLTQEEKRRIAQRYTYNMEAYEHFLRGQARVNIRTAEDNSHAREMYKTAIELDPGFARAYAGLALTYTLGFIRQWPTDVKDPLQKALEFSNLAIKLDRDLPESYWVAGFVYGNHSNNEKAKELLNYALTLNPNYADAHALMAWISISDGKPQLALKQINKALRLNPTGGYLYHMQIARAHYFMDGYKQALLHLEHAYEANPTNPDTLFYMAAVYVNLNQYDNASWKLIEAKNSNPNTDPLTFANNVALRDHNFNTKLHNDLAKAVEYYSQ